MNRLAAVDSRSLECVGLRSNPTMRRGTSRLVEREQKAESHLVTTQKGKATSSRISNRTRDSTTKNHKTHERSRDEHDFD